MTLPARSPRTGRGAAATSALAFLLLLCLTGGAARAAAPQARGYWWRLQTGVGPALPPPPNVPAGGLWVAGDARGQHAISALRYVAKPQEEISTLVLRVASSSGGPPVLLACEARSAWHSVEAGAWPDRPESACDAGFANGTTSGDGAAWSFDVRGLARGGTLDVVVLSPPDLGTVFSVGFAPPGPDTIVTRPVIGSPSPTSSSPTPSGPGTPSPRGSVFAVTTQRATPSSSPTGGGISGPESPSGDPRAAGAPTDRRPARAGWVVLAAALATLVTTWEVRAVRARG
jgi:hypothetical protein